MRLPIKAAMNIATKPRIRVKSLIRKISLMPPAMQSLDRSASIPTTSPAASDAATGACIDPGPDSENKKSEGNARNMTKTKIVAAGNAAPSSLVASLALPSEKPLERKMHPTPMPAMKPRSATNAFISPPARRRTILRGQPRKTRAPIITKKPITNRSTGLEPERGRKSPVITLMANDPRIIPMISGLIYSTIGAV